MQPQFMKDVPDSVCTDFQNLNKLNEQQFIRLIEILFQFLLEPKETDRFMQQLAEFAGHHGMSAGPLKTLMKSVLLVPQEACKKNLTAEQIREDLMALGEEHFSLQWAEHNASLSRRAVEQTLMVNQLVDMEWKFGGKTKPGLSESAVHSKTPPDFLEQFPAVFACFMCISSHHQ
uniref:COMM domain containing 7 n=1 Tax=Oryzias sinensis TaxID=183150 RepID=A0A8C7ZJQ0_9TELE